MKITEIEATVSVVPKGTVGISVMNTPCTPRQLVVKEGDNKSYEVCLLHDTKIEKRIIMDDFIENEKISNNKHEKAVCDAIEGYDAAIVFLSAGYDDNGDMCYKRTCDLESILRTLQNRMTTIDHKIKVEYAYIAITDECCYDMRTNITYTNKELCDKGFDFLMKRANNIQDIWSHFEFSQEGKPYILNIKLSDEKNLTQGHLTIIDLLYPTFSLLVVPSRQEEVLESSCVHLYNIIREIRRPTPSGSNLEDVSYFLVEVLGPYILGIKRLFISAYFQNLIDDEESLVKIKVCLDFIHSLRGSRVIMSKNKLIPKQKCDNGEIVQDTNILEDIIRKKDSTIANLTKRLDIAEKTIEQLNNNLNAVQNEVKHCESSSKYLKSCYEDDIQQKNLEIKQAFFENSQLLEKLNEKNNIIRQIKDAADAIFYYKQQFE